MLLPDDVGFELVHRRADAPTARARHSAVIADELARARAKHAHLASRLAEHAAFAAYCAAPMDAAGSPLEAELRRNPDFIQWLSTAATIRELEALARATGTGSA
jgi:hypothetical protein